MERIRGRDDGFAGRADLREGPPVHGDEVIDELMHISTLHHEEMVEEGTGRCGDDHEEGLHWIHIMQ